MQAGIRGCAAFALLAVSACSTPAAPAPTPEGYQYHITLPQGYETGSRANWPVILFLHGAGGLIPADHLIPAYAGTQPDFPFIVIAPEAREQWRPERLARVLAGVEQKYRVDPERVYVTGVSMGAFGAWNLAAAYPDRFAAIALVAGGGNPGQACTLKHLPVWLFHNRDDPVVPFNRSEELLHALQECSGDVRITAYDSVPPGVWAHNAWRAAYTNPALYEWFLEHRRGK